MRKNQVNRGYINVKKQIIIAMESSDVNKTYNVWPIILIGLLIGIVNGFFGGGGGMLCVPLLLMLGLNNQHAQASAIVVMVPISIASGFIYYTSGNIDWWIVLFVGIGSVVGGIIGATLLKKINNLSLQYIFAFVVLAAGIKMLIG